MHCPFCKAMADLANDPILMFAGGVGLGVLMATHPKKLVPVCRDHLPFAREVGEGLGIAVSFVSSEAS